MKINRYDVFSKQFSTFRGMEYSRRISYTLENYFLFVCSEARMI